jgi:hypothetical protein
LPMWAARTRLQRLAIEVLIVPKCRLEFITWGEEACNVPSFKVCETVKKCGALT